MTDLNFEKRVALVQSLHDSSTKLVLAISGGGSLILGDILTVPGASRTLIEAFVPYAEESLYRYIGREPEQCCCQRTARYMAMTAFHRGLRTIRSQKIKTDLSLDSEAFHDRSIDVSHEIDDARFYGAKAVKPTMEDDLHDYIDLIGVGCTASLVSDRKKRGEYRVHIATQTLLRTIVFSLQLVKDARSRQEEERLLADMILNAIETTRKETLTFCQNNPLPQRSKPPATDDVDTPLCHTFGARTTDNLPLSETIPLFLKPEEIIHGRQTVGSPPLLQLFFGNIEAVLWKNKNIQHFISRNNNLKSNSETEQEQKAKKQDAKLMKYSQAIFPGAFNPIHKGHLEMIDIAEKRLGNRVSLEISIQNVDKPPVDYIELENRLKEIEKARPQQAVWLTQTSLFEDKSELFSGTTFIVGADTLRRFADLRFYHESIHQLHDVLRLTAYYNCRFLVFARENESLETMNIPDMLRSLCDEVPVSAFAMNISSSDLRRNEF